MRILVAEDDSLLADGLIRALRDAGYATDSVRDGRAADTALTTQQFLQPGNRGWTGVSVRFCGLLARRDDDADCTLLVSRH